MAPAKAIIAPLSVHSDKGGKNTRALSWFKRSRSFQLAPTPPATTSESTCLFERVLHFAAEHINHGILKAQANVIAGLLIDFAVFGFDFVHRG